MLKKQFLALIILFFFSQISIAQKENIDTIKSEDYVAEKSTGSLEVTDSVEEKKLVLYFNNTADDTTYADIRLNVSDSLTKLSNQKEYQYPTDEEKKKKKIENHEPRPMHLNTDLLNFIFWVVVIVFACIVIYMFIKDNNIKMFGKKAKQIVEETKPDYNNIFELDFEKELSKALLDKDYNLAARLGFLKLLFKLNKANAISYHISKTNFDYQFQLINTKYYRVFNAAAFCYDYAWYSGAVIDETDYQKVKNQYLALENLL